MSRTSTSFFAMLATAGFITLSACGGGGGGGGSAASSPPPPPPPPPPTGSTGPTYTPGVYEASSTFEDQCENPRSGVDIEGNPFTDEQGSLVEELFWLRSWTNETYLWNDEVPDLDPYDYSDRISYFGLLKTDAVTASGAPKDDFHFSEPTEDYLASRNSAPQAGYGANFAIFQSTPPRDVRVVYTEPGSPAAEVVSGQQKLIRGSKVLTVDGVDVITSSNVDALNAAFFPDTAGETHQFEVQDPGESTTRTISLTSADIVEQPVQSTNVISTPSGDVGYIHFTTFSPFSSEEQIVNAVQQMADANVTDLVLDLRYNGGGLLAVASQLSYMIAGNARTNGATFEQLSFNNGTASINPVTGERNDPIPFYSTGLGFSFTNGAALPSLDLDTVYILSTGNTCSASEAVINGLRGIDVNVVLIGNITCGKPYGFYPTGNCGQTYYTIQFQGVNNKGFGDYADGFVPANSSFNFGVQTPGCSVPDDFTNQLGDPAEGLLSAALQYREDGTCPSVTATSEGAEKAPSVSSETREADGLTLPPPETPIFENNRDMSMPGDYRGRSQ
ncbi:MAG: S41 family peptidase [Henriciella sp.]|uniref:S41 family peptidase n=1 Tax=Henriciella sp. TaxID=1968823 RepID=UPI0032EE7B4B